MYYKALYSTLYIRPKISEGQLPLTGDIIIGEGESIDILITFSVDNLPAGEYDVSFAHISQTAQYRGIFDISVNGCHKGSESTTCYKHSEHH